MPSDHDAVAAHVARRTHARLLQLAESSAGSAWRETSASRSSKLPPPSRCQHLTRAKTCSRGESDLQEFRQCGHYAELAIRLRKAVGSLTDAWPPFWLFRSNSRSGSPPAPIRLSTEFDLALTPPLRSAGATSPTAGVPPGRSPTSTPAGLGATRALLRARELDDGARRDKMMACVETLAANGGAAPRTRATASGAVSFCSARTLNCFQTPCARSVLVRAKITVVWGQMGSAVLPRGDRAPNAAPGCDDPQSELDAKCKACLGSRAHVAALSNGGASPAPRTALPPAYQQAR